MKSFGFVLLSALFALVAPVGFAQEEEVIHVDQQEAEVRPDEQLSDAAREVIKLSDSSTDESVVMAYVTNSKYRFDLNAEDVIYLRDVGIPSNVIEAMLQRDATLNNQVAETSTSEPAPATATDETTNTVAEASPAPTVAEPAESVPEVQPFYDALSPYGTWVNISDQGWAWQPNVVVIQSSWQPYSDAGRWLWTDCGWYWGSDYTWGWAPFHYGRWWRAPRWGWVWFPGNQWAPSWVTWRTYGDYCGWAPLPPHTGFWDNGFSYHDSYFGWDHDFGLGPECYTFVNFPLFLGHDFRHHRLSHEHVNQFFHQSSVVNHFSHANNNTVVNNGVPVDRVRRSTGNQSLRPIPVADSAWGHEGGRRQFASRNHWGNTITPTRTVLPARTTSPDRTLVAQDVTTSSRIAPAVPGRLASAEGRRRERGFTQQTRLNSAQSTTGSSAWGNGNGPTATAGRQSATPSAPTATSLTPIGRSTRAAARNGASAGIAHEAAGATRLASSAHDQAWGGNREQSLTLPSQAPRSGELPHRPAPSDIRDPSGAATRPASAPAMASPRQQVNPRAERPAPAPTETFSPPAKPVMPRSQLMAPQVPMASAPVHQATTSRASVSTPSYVVSPRSSFGLSPAPAPQVSAPAASAWGGGAARMAPAPSSSASSFGRGFSSAPTASVPSHSAGGPGGGRGSGGGPHGRQ
jgi:hypothetical protein